MYVQYSNLLTPGKELHKPCSRPFPLLQLAIGQVLFDTEYKTIQVANHVRILNCLVAPIHKLNLSNPKHLDVREPAHEVKSPDFEGASSKIIEIFSSSRLRSSLAMISEEIVSGQEVEESVEKDL